MTDNNATILMSSHNLREMEDICDRILLIDRGKLVLSADIDDMRGMVNKYQLVFETDGDNIPLDSLNVSSLNNSGKMITFIADGVWLMKILDAIYESARTKSEVKIK